MVPHSVKYNSSEDRIEDHISIVVTTTPSLVNCFEEQDLRKEK